MPASAALPVTAAAKGMARRDVRATAGPVTARIGQATDQGV